MAPSAWRHLRLATLLQLLFISCLPRGTVSWQAPFYARLKERAEFSLIWQEVLERRLQWEKFYFLAGTVTESFSSFDFQRNKRIPDHLCVSHSATYTPPLVSDVLIFRKFFIQNCKEKGKTYLNFFFFGSWRGNGKRDKDSKCHI